MLDKIFTLETIGDQHFAAHHHQLNFRNALFGGQVLAQSLIAAGLTVKDRSPHSMHAYFLKPGHTQSPIFFEVGEALEGRSVSNRSVVAKQDEKIIFQCNVSFHLDEPGFEHEVTPPMPTPNPERLRQKLSPKELEQIQKIGECIGNPDIEVVPTDASQLSLEKQAKAANHSASFWFRAKYPLPTSSPLLHYAAMLFTSDIGLLASSLLPHGISLFDGRVFPASMDHAIWFHRPANFESWNLYETASPWTGNARGLCHGVIYNQDMQRVATVMQEGMIRPLK